MYLYLFINKSIFLLCQGQGHVPGVLLLFTLSDLGGMKTVIVVSTPFIIYASRSPVRISDQGKQNPNNPQTLEFIGLNFTTSLVTSPFLLLSYTHS